MRPRKSQRLQSSHATGFFRITNYFNSIGYPRILEDYREDMKAFTLYQRVPIRKALLQTVPPRQPDPLAEVS